MAEPERIAVRALDWMRGLPPALSAAERENLCVRCRRRRGLHSIGAERCPGPRGFADGSSFLGRQQ